MASRSEDKEDRPPRSVRVLERRLDVARQVRELEKSPVLEIVDIDKLRRSVARLFWFFLAVGLAYTTVGVHDFLAAGLSPADPMWWGAWCVEPCLAGILLNLMRWEAAMIARNIAIDSNAVAWLKRILLGATLIMNLVPAFFPHDGDISGGDVFAHAMIPLVVFFLAEVMPIAQARCAQARATASAKITDDQDKHETDHAVHKVASQNKPENEVNNRPVVHKETPASAEPAPAPAPAPAPVEPESEPAREPEPEPERESVSAVVVDEAAIAKVGLPPTLQGKVVDRLSEIVGSGRRPEPDDLADVGLPASFSRRVITAGINGSMS